MLLSLTNTCFQIKLIAGFGGWVGFLGYNSGTTNRYWTATVTWDAYLYSGATIIKHGQGAFTSTYDPSSGTVSTGSTTWTNILSAPSQFGPSPTVAYGPTPASSGDKTYSASGDTTLTVTQDDTGSSGYKVVTVTNLSTVYTLAEAEADLDAAIAVRSPGYAAFDAAAWNTITYVPAHYTSNDTTQWYDNNVDYSLAGVTTSNTPTAISPNSPYTLSTNPEYCVAWSTVTSTTPYNTTMFKCVGWINMAGDYAQKTYEFAFTSPPSSPAAPTSQTACFTVTGAGCGTYFEITPESITSVCWPNVVSSFVTITPGGHC
jgi:hypothetical protein